MNKASGGDGIPAELVKILTDDAIKVLHSICRRPASGIPGASLPDFCSGKLHDPG